MRQIRFLGDAGNDLDDDVAGLERLAAAFPEADRLTVSIHPHAEAGADVREGLAIFFGPP